MHCVVQRGKGAQERRRDGQERGGTERGREKGAARGGGQGGCAVQRVVVVVVAVAAAVAVAVAFGAASELSLMSCYCAVRHQCTVSVLSCSVMCGHIIVRHMTRADTAGNSEHNMDLDKHCIRQTHDKDLALKYADTSSLTRQGCVLRHWFCIWNFRDRHALRSCQQGARGAVGARRVVRWAIIIIIIIIIIEIIIIIIIIVLLL